MLNFIIRGGPVMWPLLACSFISLTFIIDRIIFWTKVVRGRDRKLVDEVLESAERGDYQKAIHLGGGSKDFIVRTLVCGLTHHHFSLSDALEMASGAEIKQMRRFLPILDTIITLSPLLGIFGTVLGIIKSFDLLGLAGIAEPRAVTAGIAQALITTATGLGIALLTLIPYNYFLSKVEDAATEIEKYGTSLEIVHNKVVGRR